jgi:hypothetical protein
MYAIIITGIFYDFRTGDGQGQHLVHIDHSILGPTCGLLPVGIESARISTSGLRWNLSTIFFACSWNEKSR